MKYLIKKLWPVILLFIAAGIGVIFGSVEGRLRDLMNSAFFCGIYVIAAGMIAHFAGNAFPRRFDTEKGFFSTHPWEKDGEIYDEVLQVKKWKDHFIDASKIFKDIKPKSIGFSRDPEKYRILIQESCAAELTHWLLILFSPLMFLIVRRFGRFFFYLIYLLANLCDIIIQRYNRPRFERIRRKLEAGS